MHDKGKRSSITIILTIHTKNFKNLEYICKNKLGGKYYANSIRKII